MPKLTEAQLVILSAAAQREDGAALPLPASLTLNKGAARTVTTSLVRRGLLAERPVGRDEETWRETDDGQRLTLAITAAGCEAIGIEPEPETDPAAAAAPQDATDTNMAIVAADAAAPAPAVRPGTKQALLVDLLRRDGGATVAEIGQATGWQPHSVRGAISGGLKKKLGLTIAADTVDGRGRVYRIVAGG